MTVPVPGRASVAATVVGALLAGCSWLPIPKSTSPAGQISDLGGGAYAVTRRSGPLAERSFALKGDAEQQALAFCAARGLALTMLDTRTDDPDPPAYSYATVQFRCVKP